MKSIVGTENETGIQASAGMVQTDISDYYESTGRQQGSGFDSGVIWNIFKRRWWLAAIVAFIVAGTGGYMIWIQKPVYESTALMLVSTSRSRTGSSSEETMSVDDLVNLAKSRSLGAQVQVLNSPDLLYTVIDTLGYNTMQKGYGDERSRMGNLFPEWALSIVPSGDLINITARAYDPDVAATVANTIARTHLKRDRTFTTQAMKQGREYVEQELKLVSSQLLTAQKNLAHFKSARKMMAPEAEITNASGAVKSLESEIDLARVEQAATDQRLASLKQRGDLEGKEIQQRRSVMDNPQYKEAETQLNKLSIQRVVLLNDFQPESNEVRRIDIEIAALQQQMQGYSRVITADKTMDRNPYLDEYISASIANTVANAKTRALSGLIAKRSSKLASMPEVELQFGYLQQNVSFLNKKYQSLTDKYSSLLANEKSTLSAALFAANAWPSMLPTDSKRKKLPKLAIFALMLAAGVVFLAEVLDKKVRDGARIARMTGEEPMSVIPSIKGLTNPFARLVDTEDHSIFLESFRILRNSLYYSDPNGAPKLLAITSPGHSEGKSTTSLCLAITVAMDSKKVLIVDCDFRRPSLYKWIQAPTDLGLSYVLAGEATVEEAIIPTSMPNLFCLPAGPQPANPSEFLNSRIGREVMNKLANDYDMVILDCPPCAGLSDMQVISRLVDGVLLVASIDRTLKKRLDEGFRMLSKVHAPLIGYVINRFSMNPKGYDYYASEDYNLPKWKKSESKANTSSRDITDV